MNTCEPLTKKPKLELNNFLFDVVNQFDLDEFTKYTNFRDLMLTILKDRSNVQDYVQRNFMKNIPHKELWMKGGFSSLKLTDGFFESDTAVRIFKRIFGIKKCSVKLDRMYDFESSKIIKKENHATNPGIGLPKENISSLRESSVRSSKASKNVNVVVKTQKKGIAPSHLAKEKKKYGLINHSKPKNFLQKSHASTSKLITVSIPFESIKCHMNTSELVDYFRRAFHDDIKNMENEFEKYVSSTDPTNLSLVDFWKTFRSEIGNEKTQTQTRTTDSIVHTFNESTNGTSFDSACMRPHHIQEIKIKREIISDEENDSFASEFQVQQSYSEERSTTPFAIPQESVAFYGNGLAAGCSEGFLSTIPKEKDTSDIHEPMSTVEPQRLQNIRSIVQSFNDFVQPSEQMHLNNLKGKIDPRDANQRRNSAESCVSKYQQQFCNFLNNGSRRKTS